MAARKKTLELEVDGGTVTITSPDRVYFPDAGYTKLDVVQYFEAVAQGALVGVRGRPMALKRFVKGIGARPFFQKRAPDNRPEFVDTVTLSYRSGHTAEEVVVRNTAALLWVVNLGCLDLNPHPVRADDLDHADELRIDLDPVRGVPWSQVRDVALVCMEVLEEHGLVAWPKTSGSKGMHIYARIRREWDFQQLRRAALTVAREVERRAPSIATARWWKEEREGVFVDYNRMAKDATVASVYSVRPLKDARVSAPLHWHEVPVCEPEDFNLRTMIARYGAIGDVGAGLGREPPGSLASLLELADRHEADGVGGDVPGAGSTAPKIPTRTIANHPDLDEAMAGWERWKARHPDVVPHLRESDLLVDGMRGRSSTWTRVRVRLSNVPDALHPPQETPDPDVDPTREWRREWQAARKRGDADG